jgi:hypothetical protein
MIDASLSITPSTVGFNGGECILSWQSSGAEYAIVTSVGKMPPNGSAKVFPTRDNTLYVVEFGNYTETYWYAIEVVVEDDPADKVIDSPLSMITVRVVRNIGAGLVSVNGRNTGTPSFVISSRLRPREYVEPISDDNLGVL